MAVCFRNSWVRNCSGALLAWLATGCGPELYLMEKKETRVGDDWFYQGGGCMSVDDGQGSSSWSGATGSGSSNGSDYETSLIVQGGQAEFTVRLAGAVVEHRVFDQEFLESGRVETVTVDLPDGEAQRFTFWGGSECEAPAEPDTEAYEQAKRDAQK